MTDPRIRLIEELRDELDHIPHHKPPCFECEFVDRLDAILSTPVSESGSREDVLIPEPIANAEAVEAANATEPLGSESLRGQTPKRPRTVSREDVEGGKPPSERTGETPAVESSVSPPSASPDVRRLVDRQAEDEGLWFEAETAPEAYLQQELRRLHAAIEAEPVSREDVEGVDQLVHGDEPVTPNLGGTTPSASPDGYVSPEHSKAKCPYEGGWCTRCGQPFERSLVEVSEEQPCPIVGCDGTTLPARYCPNHRGEGHDAIIVGEPESVSPLMGAAKKIATEPCEASAWHSIPEDGVERCLDPEFIEMSELPPGESLQRCYPCLFRRALSQVSESKE